jgi:hypothetical protein
LLVWSALKQSHTPMPILTPRGVRRLENISVSSERKWPWLLSIWSALLLVLTLMLDWKRPLWNDELFTVYISQQPTLSDVWHALMTGAEQLPPFFFVIVRIFTSALGSSPIVFRLPETLGFLIMSLSLFFFVQKRVPSSYGLLAFIFPAVTNAYYFSYEARPYGLVMGFCGLALLNWQAAAEGRKRPLSLIGLAIFLACAIDCHYYALLALFPFAVAECARFLASRKLDWAMYGAIVVSVAPLTIYFPLIRAASKYSSTFWAKPQWTSLVSFYENLLVPAGLSLLLLTLIAGLCLCFRFDRDQEQLRYASIPMRDIALALGFVLLPTVAIFVAKLVTGAFTSRYAVYSVLGVGVLLAWSLARIGWGRATVGFLIAAATLGCWLVIVVRQYREFVAARAEQADTFGFLVAQEHELPLVIASPHQFFVQSRWAAIKHRGHFIYLADTAMALRYTNTDDVERGLITLKDYAPLDVQEYHGFVASHRMFLLYGYPDPFGWILQDLLRTGSSISLKARNGDSLLYLVRTPGSPRRGGDATETLPPLRR